MTKLNEVTKAAKAAGVSEDLGYGQHVIVTARWILVLTGLLLAMWNPAELGQLKAQFVFLLVLAVANFYLHAQLLMGRYLNPIIVYGASAGDLVVITSMIILGGGFKSDIFVFYFPAILVFSVAFPRFLTFLYTLSAMGVYGLICLVTIGSISTGDWQALIARLIMMAAVAVVGSQYLRIERGRREAASEARLSLMEEIRAAQNAEPAS